MSLGSILDNELASCRRTLGRCCGIANALVADPSLTEHQRKLIEELQDLVEIRHKAVCELLSSQGVLVNYNSVAKWRT